MKTQTPKDNASVIRPGRRNADTEVKRMEGKSVGHSNLQRIWGSPLARRLHTDHLIQPKTQQHRVLIKRNKDAVHEPTLTIETPKFKTQLHQINPLCTESPR
jgi:hypothetical protein